MTATTTVLDVRHDRRVARGHRRRLGFSWLGASPFLIYVAIFLLLPTILVVVGAFVGPTGLTLDNISTLSEPQVIDAFVNSITVSAASSAIGAVAGGVLSYAVATAKRDGWLRRFVTAACGVLGLFGGVSLAFAFIATFGAAGLATSWLASAGMDLDAKGVWLYSLSGLTLVYSYFQIPLMVLVFLPAVDGIQPRWREAAESLGSSTWDYWRRVGLPVLTPAFLGSTLLLFANAFSAFATVAALISQGGILIPLRISNALSSEVGVGTSRTANALALAMIVVVAFIMAANVVLQRKTARWLG